MNFVEKIKAHSKIPPLKLSAILMNVIWALNIRERPLMNSDDFR